MAAISSQQTDIDVQPDFAGSRVFDKVFAEGMALVERTATYLDGPGRDMSRRLRAVRDGDMSRDDALAPKYRISRDGPPLEASAQRGSGLPDSFLDLVENAEALYSRICRLDEAIYLGEAGHVEGPVNRQIEELETAAQQGAFDPLRVWGRAR